MNRFRLIDEVSIYYNHTFFSPNPTFNDTTDCAWVVAFQSFLVAHLHKVDYNEVLVTDENMGLCLYICTIMHK